MYDCRALPHGEAEDYVPQEEKKMMFKSAREWFSLVRKVRHLEAENKKLLSKLSQKSETITQLLSTIKEAK